MNETMDVLFENEKITEETKKERTRLLRVLHTVYLTESYITIKLYFKLMFNEKTGGGVKLILVLVSGHSVYYY